MHPADHVQPPGPYDRPWQPPVYMMAYLGIHVCLTNGQTVSGPMALGGFMAAHHSQLVLTCTHPQSDSSPCCPSDLALSIGHPMYISVPMQHNYSTLWSNMHTSQGAHHSSQAPVI